MQFCKIPVAGTGAIVATFVVLFLIYRKIITDCFQINTSFLAFYPAMYLLFLFSLINYSLSIVWAHLLTSLFFYLYIKINNTNLRYTTGFLLLFPMYWAANTIFFTAVALFIIFELCCKRQKYGIIISLLYLLISLPLPELSYRIFSLPYEECYFSGFWIMETLIVAKDVELIYPSLAVFPIVFLMVFFGKFFSLKLVIVRKIIHPLLSILLFVGLIVMWINNRHETRTLKGLYLLRNENWQEMIVQVQKNDKPIFVEMLLYNFAIARQPSFPKFLLFDHKNSFMYYRTEMIRGILRPCFSSELYFHMGFVNGAYYDFFNINKSFDRNGSAYCLLRMAQIQTVKGQYALAEKYYTVLSKTLFYSRQARKNLHMLSHPAVIEQNESIIEKRKLLEHDNFFWSKEFLENLVNYVDMGTDNRLASEYLIGFILLTAELPQLMKYLEPVVAKYYNYTDIPEVYQQAALCCYPDSNPVDLEKWNITEKNRQLYEQFLKDTQSRNKTSDLLKKYEQSYFYYLLNI